MRAKTYTLLIASLFFVFGYSASDPKEKTPWQRDVRQYRQHQREMRADYKEYFRQQNSIVMKEKLTKNKELTEYEKEDLIVFFQNQQEIWYEKVVPLKDPRYAGDLVLFEKISNDPNIEFQDKKTAIKTYFEKISKSHDFRKD